MWRNLKFHYTLELSFSDDVKGHNFTLRMIPQSDEQQKITECTYSVSPECELRMDIDTFGNKYIYGNIEEPHNFFKVDVDGIAMVDTSINGKDSANKHKESEIVYRYQSKYTKAGNALNEYHKSLVKRKGETDFDYVTGIMHKLYKDFKYVKGVTDINTTAEGALELKSGVCQDYSHIMIALLRMSGIPARYVVGMMMGEGFSHAWVEVCIEGVWVGFDPTNDKIVDDTYIKISNGRDYQDCIVNRGVFYGNVTQKQNIKVAVSEV
jgi:transglutaminase-like putative cysteine protease